jgi:hypothetical protein
MPLRRYHRFALPKQPFQCYHRRPTRKLGRPACSPWVRPNRLTLVPVSRVTTGHGSAMRNFHRAQRMI